MSETGKSKGLPTNPRQGGQIMCVMWVVANDHRPLNATERRNVIYPGKKAGLIAEAVKDGRGVKLNEKGDTSVCEFVLTEEGHKYYDEVIKPMVPKGFVSNRPKPPVRRQADAVSTADLGRG